MADRNFQNASRDSKDSQAASSPARPKLKPGDEAASGTPGTGEDVCPLCHGQGRIMHTRCPKCGGRGKVVRGIDGV